MKNGAALLILAVAIHAAHAHGDPPRPPRADRVPRAPTVWRAEARGPRVSARDILGPAALDVDLGVAPAPSAPRIVDRTEIERAYENAKLPPPRGLPHAVRIVRKIRRLDATEVGRAVRTALAETPLPRGATLANVRAPAVEVAADFRRVRVDLPAQLPRRAGAITVHTNVTFLGEDDAPSLKALVPIELLMPPSAALPDIVKGAPLALIVRRGLVEVSITAVAAGDADVGAVLPVTLKPSGRVLRARAIDKDHAVAMEDS